MKTFKKVLSIIMIAAVIASICVVSTVTSGAACTGAGLAEWALRAYNEGWSYSIMPVEFAEICRSIISHFAG